MKPDKMFEKRWYRDWVKDEELFSFSVRQKETELFIRAERNLIRESEESLRRCRQRIETYLTRHPEFADSLRPVNVDSQAPVLIKKMADAAAKTGVGPMAAVAGAVAESVGEDLSSFSRQVIVENGGDLFLSSSKERILGVYAGLSAFSGKLKLRITPEQTPLGICTSSGTVGPSLSFGKADAALVMAGSTILADACATAVGNLVKNPADFNRAIDFARSVEEVRGVLLIMGDKLAAWGEVEMV